MNDHATTGGYAIAGTVITADLPLAGQLAPGDRVEFEACSLDHANTELRLREAALDAA
jgi:antagonist of KipI